MVSLSFSKFTAADVAYQLAHYGEDRRHEITAMTTTFFVITLIFVGLRFFTKRIKHIGYAVEDYLILLALVSGSVAPSCVNFKLNENRY
jgi:hypothetical protein